MKLSFTTILVFFLFLQNIFSQQSCFQETYSPKALYDVAILSSDIIIAIGQRQIIKSYDGGHTWKQIKSCVSGGYSIGNSLVFLDNKVGFLGTNGTISKTLDGGETWSHYRLPSIVDIYDIDFSSDSIGIAVGDEQHIFKTIDGGKTWNILQSGFSSSHSYNSVKFINDTTVIVASRGECLKSQDSGLSWATIPVPLNNQNVVLSNIQFLSSEIGFISGNTQLFKTENGGNTWIEEKEFQYPILDLHFNSLDTGFVLLQSGSFGGYSSVTRTLNGSFWQANTSGQGNAFVFKNQKGFLVGGDYNDHDRYISKTNNLGDNWTVVSSKQSSDAYTHSHFFDSNIGLAASEREIIRTIDKGVTWKTVKYIPSVGALEFLDDQTGFLFTFTDSVYQTNDRGLTWHGVAFLGNLASGSYTRKAGIFSKNHWLVARNTYEYFETKDKGQSWTLKSTLDLQDIVFMDSLRWYGARYTDFYYTLDGGQTWNNTLIGNNVFINDIEFYDENFGIASGDNGKTFKTTDGGLTWSNISIAYNGSNVFCEDILIISPSHFFISFKWFVYETTDGGATYEQVLYTTSQDFEVALPHLDTMFVFTDYGEIRKIIPGQKCDISTISGKSPACFGQTEVYSIMNFSYLNTATWILDSGGSITSNNQSVIGIKWTELGIHQLSVSTDGPCGPSSLQTFSIKVEAINNLPTINRRGVDTLIASDDQNIQWFKDGELILEANNDTLVAISTGTYRYSIENSCGMRFSEQVIVSRLPEDIYTLDDIMLFPNPAKDFVTLKKIKRVNQIEIYDASGKHIKSIEPLGLNEQIVDISDLHNGVYFFIMIQNDETQMFKLIVFD